MAKHTPMIEQYLKIKADYKDAFLFFGSVIFMKCFMKMQSKLQGNWKLR